MDMSSPEIPHHSTWHKLLVQLLEFMHHRGDTGDMQMKSDWTPPDAASMGLACTLRAYTLRASHYWFCQFRQLHVLRMSTEYAWGTDGTSKSKKIKQALSMETFCTNLSAFLRLLATWLDRHLLKNTYLQRPALTTSNKLPGFNSIVNSCEFRKHMRKKKQWKNKRCQCHLSLLCFAGRMRTSAQIRSAAWHVPGYASLPKSAHTWKPIHAQLKDTSSENSPMNGHGALALVSVQCCGQANLESNPLSSLHLWIRHFPESSSSPMQWLYCDSFSSFHFFAFLCFLQLFLRPSLWSFSRSSRPGLLLGVFQKLVYLPLNNCQFLQVGLGFEKNIGGPLNIPEESLDIPWLSLTHVIDFNRI